MKTRYAVLVLIVAVAAACSLDLIQTQTLTNPTGTSPTAAPSPGATPTPLPTAAVETVRIAEIGREGGAGCVVAGEPTVLPPAPCKAILTCTPLDAAGRDVGLGYTPEWEVAGNGGFTETSVNPFNGRAECDSGTGSILLTCKVGGKAGVKGYLCRG